MSINGLIGFAIALAITAILVFPLGDALKKHPWAFYAVSLVVVGVYIWANAMKIDMNGIRFLTVILQKGFLALILLAVVMFCGCFDEGSALRRKIQPIRGELSILSFIFILGHLGFYLPTYLPRLGIILGSRTNVALSLILSIVLAVLFAVLAITSFRTVRHHMGARAWKNLQRFSYLMVGILAVHIFLVLSRSAATGAAVAQTSLICYLVVIGAYAVLRIAKAIRDSKRASKQQAA